MSPTYTFRLLVVDITSKALMLVFLAMKELDLCIEELT